MKAIRQISKAEKDRINQLARQNVAEWLRKNEAALTRRVLKVVCVSLNEGFGFGAERLSKLVKLVNKTTDEWHNNPCFWTMIDRRLEQIGIPLKRKTMTSLNINGWMGDDTLAWIITSVLNKAIRKQFKTSGSLLLANQTME